MVLDRKTIIEKLDEFVEKDSNFFRRIKGTPFQTFVSDIKNYFENYNKGIDDFVATRIQELNKLNVVIGNYITQKTIKDDTGQEKVDYLRDLMGQINDEIKNLRHLFDDKKYE